MEYGPFLPSVKPATMASVLLTSLPSDLTLLSLSLTLRMLRITLSLISKLGGFDLEDSEIISCDSSVLLGIWRCVENTQTVSTCSPRTSVNKGTRRSPKWSQAETQDGSHSVAHWKIFLV